MPGRPCSEILAEFNAETDINRRMALANEYSENGCGVLDPYNPDQQSGNHTPAPPPPPKN